MELAVKSSDFFAMSNILFFKVFFLLIYQRVYWRQSSLKLD